ncbi:MAG: MFS transporter family glucose-6-phosphate receptor UhpC, partial [Haemophilus parainfluenzae]|nr:MFS transporter family glucose-6-phosphate receptor UhpC [Haemophilus parainfluenzae]
APLAWIIQSLHWNGFFGSLFIVSLACALLLVFVYFLQRKKNKLKA